MSSSSLECDLAGDVPNPFADPSVRRRLEAHETTRPYLQDPEFVKILDDLAKDPGNLMKNMQDHRVMTAMAVLLDIDLKKTAGVLAFKCGLLSLP